MLTPDRPSSLNSYVFHVETPFGDYYFDPEQLCQKDVHSLINRVYNNRKSFFELRNRIHNDLSKKGKGGKRARINPQRLASHRVSQEQRLKTLDRECMSLLRSLHGKSKNPATIKPGARSVNINIRSADDWHKIKKSRSQILWMGLGKKIKIIEEFYKNMKTTEQGKFLTSRQLQYFMGRVSMCLDGSGDTFYAESQENMDSALESRRNIDPQFFEQCVHEYDLLNFEQKLNLFHQQLKKIEESTTLTKEEIEGIFISLGETYENLKLYDVDVFSKLNVKKYQRINTLIKDLIERSYKVAKKISCQIYMRNLMKSDREYIKKLNVSYDDLNQFIPDVLRNLCRRVSVEFCETFSKKFSKKEGPLSIRIDYKRLALCNATRLALL